MKSPTIVERRYSCETGQLGGNSKIDKGKFIFESENFRK